MRDTLRALTKARQLQSKAAQTIKRPVSSKISMHFSVRVSSKASSCASDSPGGGNTLRRPSSSSYRTVFASTLAWGHSLFASKVSSVSFRSRMFRCVSAMLSLFTANDLLGSVDELNRPGHLSAGDFCAYPWLPVIGSFSDSKRRSQIIPENSGVELSLVNQISIESGMEALVTPF